MLETSTNLKGQLIGKESLRQVPVLQLRQWVNVNVNSIEGPGLGS